MSTTDNARLDAIDRRARAAARTLLDDLAAREAGGLDASNASVAVTAKPTGPADLATAPIGPEVSEPMVGDLYRPSDRRAGRWERPRFLVTAAVLVFAIGGVLAVIVGGDDSNVSSNSEPYHLLADWLPERFEAVSATGYPDTAAITGLDFSFDIAVYGNQDLEDPWSARLVVAHLFGDGVGDQDLPEGEAVTVAGHDAILRQDDGFWYGGPEQAWEVTWPVNGLMTVAGASRDEVLAAARAATTEPAIDPSGLPDGYALLARGPYAAADLTLYNSLYEGLTDPSVLDSLDGSGLMVTYADLNDSEGARSAVVVAQRPGPASAVDLVRLGFSDGAVTTVRGHHAMIGRGQEELPGFAGESGVVAVQWAEPDGQLVTVVGFSLAEDEVLQVAEGLRPAAVEEIAALREERAASPRVFDAVPDGHIVVADGESLTGKWRIVSDGRHDNIGALTIDRQWGAIAGTSTTTGDRIEPPLDLGADISDGTIVVWGVLWVDAATVAVESPGVEPVTLDIHDVEGWEHPVIAGSFPDDLFPVFAGEVVVVARDADGNEVGRNETVLGGD